MKGKMTAFSLIAGGLLGLFAFSSPGVGGEETPQAKAILHNPKGDIVGTVWFEETAQGVRLTVRIDGLPAGTHALHIHGSGDCQPPDFKSVGGHFNPYGAKHGFLNPAGPHAGDLPNFTVGEDGTADFQVITNRVTLKKGEKNSLFQEGGTSVVIHINPDDYLTDPAGNGGARIACGTIEEVPSSQTKGMTGCPMLKEGN